MLTSTKSHVRSDPYVSITSKYIYSIINTIVLNYREFVMH